MDTSTDPNGEQNKPQPVRPIPEREFEGVAILDNGQGVNIHGKAIDHIVFLIRVTAQLSQIPARVKEFQFRDVTGRVIIHGLTNLPPRR